MIKQSRNKVHEALCVLREVSKQLEVLSRPEIQRREYRRHLLETMVGVHV